MPWKDAKKRTDEAAKYRKENYLTITLSIRIDSGIPKALLKMQDLTSIPPSTYAHIALREKLQREGYLGENPLTE